MLVEVLILLGVVAALLLWAAIAPRSQWRILVAWAYRDPGAYEPSDRSHRLRRIMGIIGIIPLVFVGYAFATAQRPAPKGTGIPLTYQAAQAEAGRLWSSPTGSVSLNTSPPVADHAPSGSEARLVPLVGYAAVDPASRQPGYLYALNAATGQNGSPDAGTYLLVGSASGCDPDELMITESATEIRVGLFEAPYSRGESLQDCLLRGPNNTGPAVSLFPIDHAPGASLPFGAAVGKRKVIDMATGRPLGKIG